MSTLLSHLVLLSENIHLRKHFKENEKEMIKEDDIESKKGGHTMTCGMKGVVYSSTARRRAGRRGEGWAVRAHTHVCTHVCTVRIVMCAVCAHTRVYSPVCCVHSHVAVCAHTRVCIHLCAMCIVTCAGSVCCVCSYMWLCVYSCVYAQSCVLCVQTHLCIHVCAVCSHVCYVCTHTCPCVYSHVCCVQGHACSGHVLYLLAVFARAWRAQGYRGSGRLRGLGQSVGEGPEWGSPLKRGEGTGQRLGLAGVRRRVRSPWRLAWPGGVPGGCGGYRAWLGDKGTARGLLPVQRRLRWGERCLLLGFREMCGKEEGGALPSPGAAPGT